MKEKFIILFLLLLSNLYISAQLHTKTVFLKHEGYNRYYKFYVPNDFTQQKTYPVVLILHGGGGTAKGMVRFTKGRFNKLADNFGFVAVYPNGFGKSWNDGGRDTLAKARKLNIDDVGFIEKVIDDLDSKINVDKNNIFACGISNGGFMVQRLALEIPELIRGIGVVAANLSADQIAGINQKNPVPVIFINGTSDPLVPYNGGPVMVLKQKRGKVMSVDESTNFWIKNNECTKKISEEKIPDVNKRDDCSATKTIYQNPRNPKIKMEVIKIENGGHTWPGTKQYLPKKLVGNTNRDFNACDEIWQFFQSVKQ